MSVISICRLLPFHAWPFWLRMVVWCTCALAISFVAHRLYIHAVGPGHQEVVHNVGAGTRRDDLAENNERSDGLSPSFASDIVGVQQHRLAAVRRKLESLPALRLKGAAAIRCTGRKAPTAAVMPSNGETDALAVFAVSAADLPDIDGTVPRSSPKDAPCPEVHLRSGAVTSNAALLAWIEHIVFASDVILRRFEPVVHELAQQVGGLYLGEHAMVGTPMTRLDGGTQSTQAADSEANGNDVALADGALMPVTYRAADIEIGGSYVGFYRFLEQLARTEPPLIIVSSRVRSDDSRLRWEARIVVTDAGQFRLGMVPGIAAGIMSSPGDADRAGGTVAPNPFARSVLSGTAQTARLIGVMRFGSRHVGLFAQGSKRYLLEAGAMLGDARIVGIHSEDGTSRADLAPLTGESPRVLWLRSRN